MTPTLHCCGILREPWLEQLRQKQRLFPGRYDFGGLEDIASITEMTTWLVRRAGLYEDAEAYFANYAVLGGATVDLKVQAHIITARDDFVVPVADFYGLAPNPNLRIEIHDHGGHVGYVEGMPPVHRVGLLVREAIEADNCGTEKADDSR